MLINFSSFPFFPFLSFIYYFSLLFFLLLYRLAIGVELAANPAILFLDEPTTGNFLLYIRYVEYLQLLH